MSGAPRRPLPCDHAAEVSVLGGILWEGRKLVTQLRLQVGLQAQDFYEEAHQVLAAAAYALVDAGAEVDSITVVEQLLRSRSLHKLKFLGGAEYVSKLFSEHNHSAPVLQHGALVRDKAESRRLLLAASKVVEQGYQGAPPARMAADIERLQVQVAARQEDLPCSVLSGVQEQHLSWLWAGRIPYGALTLICGDPGKGKSVLTCHLTAVVTMGGMLPCDQVRHPEGNVLLIAHEDPLAPVVKPRMVAAGADVERVFNVSTPPVLPDDVRRLAKTVKDRQVRMVIIDPITAYLSRGLSAYSDQDVRAALAPLAQLAEAEGIAVVVVAHMNKRMGGPGMYRVGGSIGFIGQSRSALLVAPDPQDPERRILAPLKANLAPGVTSLAFTLEGPAGGQPHVVWLGESRLTADALLDQDDKRKPTVALKTACDVLRSILEKGPVLASEAEEQAEACGVSERTLRRAKGRLGVISRRKVFQGPYFWQLPPEADSPDA